MKSKAGFILEEMVPLMLVLPVNKPNPFYAKDLVYAFFLIKMDFLSIFYKFMPHKLKKQKKMFKKRV